MRLWFLLVLAASCGTLRDTLDSKPTQLAAIHAPHEVVLVNGPHGLARVAIDTGQIDVIDESPDAILAAGGITFHRTRNDTFEVRRGGVATLVPGVVSSHVPIVSPDRKRFAVTEHPGPATALATQPKPAIVVVELATLAVHRFPVDSLVTIKDWDGDGAIGFWSEQDNARMRLDLATAAVTPVIEPEEPLQASAPITCRDKGRQLDVTHDGHHQRIVLTSVAQTSDPEHVAAIAPRVLVSASWGVSNVHGDLYPHVLASLMFSSSCDQFLFSFADEIYVGDIATGAFAWLIAGSSVEPDRDEPGARPAGVR